MQASARPSTVATFSSTQLEDVFRADFGTDAVAQARLRIHHMQLLGHRAPRRRDQANLLAGNLYFSTIILLWSSGSEFM
jgi:hypothetical protein